MRYRVDDSLVRKWEFLKFKGDLGLSTGEAQIYLACLWLNGIEALKDGLDLYDFGKLAEFGQWGGEDKKFARALLDSGFITIRGRRIYLNHVERYVFPLVGARRKNYGESLSKNANGDDEGFQA